MSELFAITLHSVKSFFEGDGPIVVVDDDESQLKIVKICYRKSKCSRELICILGGEGLLTLAQKIIKSEVKMPEVVLLDINMPRKNGFDILKEIRTLAEFKELPNVVMFTSSESEKDKDEAKRLKANGFVSKPSDVYEYINFFSAIA